MKDVLVDGLDGNILAVFLPTEKVLPEMAL